MRHLTPELLIAPCGMNCRVCYAFQRDKNKCPGCRSENDSKPKSRVICNIKTCSKFNSQEIRFCGQCDIFPCKNLKNLDKRYQGKYFMSMIRNQELIIDGGVEKFIEAENKKWKCSRCGHILCAHKSECKYCGLPLSGHFSCGW